MKNFWLIKTEPENDWSWNDQLKKNIEGWDGVRNFAARKNLQSMKNKIRKQGKKKYQQDYQDHP